MDEVREDVHHEGGGRLGFQKFQDFSFTLLEKQR